MDQLTISSRSFWLIIFLVFLVSLVYLGKVQLRAEEPKRALVSMEMNLSGNYLTPTTFTKNYYSKPPLYNWVLAALYSAIGPYDWVSRLISVFSFVLTGIGIYSFLRNKVGNERARLSSIFYFLSMPLLFYGSLVGEIDLFYCFLVFIQISVIFHFFRKNDYALLFLVSYLLMAAGVLTKGLPSLAFQAITLLVLFIYEKKFWVLFSLRHVLGILMGMGIISCYFYIYGQYHDPLPYLGRLFFAGSRRISGGEADTTKYLTHFISFPFTLIYLMMPGLLFGFAAKKKKVRDAFKNKWVIYCALFIIFNLILYFISPWTRLRYLFPFIPFLAIMLGCAFYEVSSERLHKTIFILFIVVVVASVVSLFLPLTIHFRVPVAIFSVLAMLTAFLHHRKYLQPVMAFSLLFILLKLVFAFTVLESRSQTDQKKGLLDTVDEVAAYMTDKTLYYYSPVDTASYNILGTTTTHQSIDRLSYAFAFYYERKTQKLLEHQNEITPGYYYLVDEEYISQLRNIEIIQSVDIHKDKYYLIKG